MRVSEKAKTLLQETCTHRVPNNTTRTCRLPIRSLYSLSKALTRKPPHIWRWNSSVKPKQMIKGWRKVSVLCLMYRALLLLSWSQNCPTSQKVQGLGRPHQSHAVLTVLSKRAETSFSRSPPLPSEVRVGYVQTFEVVVSNIRPNLTGTDSARKKILSGQNQRHSQANKS